MEKALLLFLVLFPLLASAWVYPLRRRSREYRNRLIQIVPLVELAAALLLLLLSLAVQGVSRLAGRKGRDL